MTTQSHSDTNQIHRCDVCGCDLGWDAPSGVCSTACLMRAHGFDASDPYDATFAPDFDHAISKANAAKDFAAINAALDSASAPLTGRYRVELRNGSADLREAWQGNDLHDAQGWYVEWSGIVDGFGGTVDLIDSQGYNSDFHTHHRDWDDTEKVLAYYELRHRCTLLQSLAFGVACVAVYALIALAFVL